ncbi:hypothetical protein B0H13DRAFT_2000517 [Mycena leptocephala]|nr:hypothetical protein B0H13DRAFT_2000517 [Mycena leptocephala]
MTTAPPAPPASTTSVNPAAGLSDLFTVASGELRAEISMRTPILFSSAGEPYLALPAPLERFYLSPMRASDVPHDIAMMSDIRVARMLVGPPFPVPIAASQRWLVRERAFVTALFDAYAAGNFLPASCDPFSVLRERLADGSEAYVGQVTVMYTGDDEKRRTPVNDAWEEWRSRTKVWEIGGAGIASAAIGVVLKDWAVAQMGCTEIPRPMLLLWEKYGFVDDPALRQEITVTEAKGGGVEQGCALVWYLK